MESRCTEDIGEVEIEVEIHDASEAVLIKRGFGHPKNAMIVPHSRSGKVVVEKGAGTAPREYFITEAASANQGKSGKQLHPVISAII